MDIKEQLFNLIPTTQNIELENRGIYRVEGIVELLKRFKDLKRISLKNNNIKYLPDNFDSLQCLEEVDISGNPIDNLNDVLVPLQNLRNLKSLHISLSSFEEEQFIIQQLPDLVYLNQKKIPSPQPVEHNQNEEEEEEQQRVIQFEDYDYFQNENIEEASVCIDYIRQQKISQMTYYTSKQLIFQDLKELYIENNMGSEQEIQKKYDSNLSKIILDLKEKCSQQQNDNYASNLIQLKQKYSLYELCFSKAIEFTEKIDERLFESLASIHDSHAIIFKQMSKMIQEQAKIIDQLRNESPIQADTSNELQRLNDFNFYQNVRALQDQIDHLQNENKKYLDKIIRLSKGDYPLRDSTSQKLNASNNKIDLANTNPSINISISNAKNLSLNQLKETIHEIYASKEWFDTKEQKNQKLPPQTMEMHMYEYLTQKYGLKSIVIEQASTIIYSIKKLSLEDNDIAVFTKILRNECDENFRFVQGQLKRTIKELLNMHLKGKYPLKNTNELKTMVDTKTSGLISVDEASDIISYMYNKDDSKSLMEKIQDLVLFTPQSPQKKKGQKREDPAKENYNQKKKIPYSGFEKIVLDFQLKSHEKFLKPFIGLFKQVDTDQDGVITEDEFRSLISLINLPIPPNDIEKFLKELDPYTTQLLTFSQLVNYFSEEVIQVEGSSMSVLQHLSINSNI